MFLDEVSTIKFRKAVFIPSSKRIGIGNITTPRLGAEKITDLLQ